MKKKKICVFTGSRAEYGLLSSLIRKIKKSRRLELQIIVSGMHLSSEFGLTYREIEEDGCRIDDKVEMLLSSDTKAGIGKSIGLGVIGLVDSINRLSPDAVVILGDRFEALSAAIAAMTLNIPIIHLYGGEVTLGVMDESIRHAITKMSRVHFTSTEVYRERVLQLGEDPGMVFNVGAIGLDNIYEASFLSRRQLSRAFGISWHSKNILVTFHPVTLDDVNTYRYFQNLLSVLDKYSDVGVIFTKANADAGGRCINNMIVDFVKKRKNRASLFSSLGRHAYISLLRQVDVVAGNSSSGIVEAASFRLPCIDIGDRQQGRIRPRNVIHVNSTVRAIQNGMNQALSADFRSSLRGLINPYGDGKTASRIVRVLESVDWKDLGFKKFFDRK